MYKQIYAEFWAESGFIEQIKFFADLVCTQDSQINITPISISQYKKLPFILWNFSNLKHLTGRPKYKGIKHINSNSTDLTADMDKIIQNISNERELLDLKIEEFEVGRDILEGYLIENKTPKIQFDERFQTYAKNCLYIYGEFRRYWENSNKNVCLIVSHGLYKWGIIAKAAMASGIDVFCLSQHSFYKLTPNSQYCTLPFEKYKNIFNSLDDNLKNLGISWAEKRLEKRLGGQAGLDIKHNSVSAFGENSIELNIDLKDCQDESKSIVICPSCFFDNPHAYGKFMFSNFWDWFEFVGENSNPVHTWLVKAHPDALDGNLTLLHEICKKYPHLKLIDNRIKFQELAKNGVTICLSVYGSVGHELPFLGIDVVNCANNPHAAFEFNYHLSNREDLKYFLKFPESIVRKGNLEEIYAFYFIHFLYSKPVSIEDYLKGFSNSEPNNQANMQMCPPATSHHYSLFKEWLSTDMHYMTPSINQVNKTLSLKD